MAEGRRQKAARIAGIAGIARDQNQNLPRRHGDAENSQRPEESPETRVIADIARDREKQNR